VPAHPWELRAAVRPLEVAAVRWSEVGALMARRGEEIVEAARRATEGWDAAAAEGYEAHRRRVLTDIDRFATLADLISGSLRAVAEILTASQHELDESWTAVALVPHELVGESRHLVLRPSTADERGTVVRGLEEVEEIRRRLTLALDKESARLRGARAELAAVRAELTALAGGTVARGLVGGVPGVLPGLAPGEEPAGVGTFLAASRRASSSVPGSAQTGVAALRPPASAVPAVSLPHLAPVSAAALAPFVASPAPGVGARQDARHTSAAPPMSGVGAGAMGARAGTMPRGTANGRSGTDRKPATRMPTTRTRKREDEPSEETAATTAVQHPPGEEPGERRR
jgi:hypothetical protein